MPDAIKPTIVLGVTGGIACYKAVELARLLVKADYRVRVIMTRAALEFVTPLTFQTISGYAVATEIFDLTQESEIGHINLADSAALMVIAPATANVIGKITSGIADDLLTTVVMATHDQRIVDAMRRRVLELDHGTLVRDQARGVYGVGG